MPDLKGNRQAWETDADGHYTRKGARGTLSRSAQMMLLEKLAEE